MCKVGPVGEFRFDLVYGGSSYASDVKVSSPVTINVTQAGVETCTTILTRTEGTLPSDPAATVQITEQAAPGTTLTSITTTGGTDEVQPTSSLPDRRVTLSINAFHSAKAVFTNVADHVETGCTYTKGWYRNNGSNTILALVDGRTKAQQQAIFDATPGKPGGVTWTGSNNNLNLYQQLLAALNNLGGDADAGPAEVDAAIAAALAATGGSNLHITVAAGTDVSGLIDVLSAFNEGAYLGWPHCDD